ncbi:MAG: purine-nucleoside phosphorylase [Gammaproteobacteria bacterium]|nr:purine-nucleoside phosphorylase [Gammaproteobacteria bacterium]
MSVSMQESIQAIRRYAPNFNPKIGIILGSGLGALTEELQSPISIPYQAIPGLVSGQVSGHASLLVMGYLQDVPVVCLKGRLHCYEGVGYGSLQTLVRIVKYLGASSIIITGAAGSLRPEVGAGEMMLLNDHIHFQGGNPLVGPNDESIGPRFMPLENAYDRGLRDIFQAQAAKLGFKLPEGVYISVLGPSFETPAEIRAFRQWGADAVGMSVVPEVIIARHCGLQVAAVAAITNLAVGLSTETVTHDVTLRNAELAGRKLTKLVSAAVSVIGHAE